MSADPLRTLAELLSGPTIDGRLIITADLARQLIRRHECSDRLMSYGDEDGPMPPAVLICRLQEGHDYDHYNGYTHWSDACIDRLVHRAARLADEGKP